MGASVAKTDVRAEDHLGSLLALVRSGQAKKAAIAAKQRAPRKQLPQLLRHAIMEPSADVTAVDTLAKTIGPLACAWVDEQKRTTLVYGLEERLPEEKLLALLGNMADDDLLLVAANGWTALPLACEAAYEGLAVAIVERLPYGELTRDHQAAAYESYGCGFAAGNAMRMAEPVACGVALHYAARRGLCRVIEALLSRLDVADVPKRDWSNNTPLAVALLRGHHDAAKKLLQDGPLEAICHPLNVLASTSAEVLAEVMERYSEEISAMPEKVQHDLLMQMVHRRSFALLEVYTPYVSSAVITRKSSDCQTAADACEKSNFQEAIPLLQRVGPKSAAM